MIQPCKIDTVNANLDFLTRIAIDRLSTAGIIAEAQCGL